MFLVLVNTMVGMIVNHLNTMKRFLSSLFLVLCLLGVAPSIVHAQNAAPRLCDCFCATKQGAKPPGSNGSASSLQSMTTDQCQAACKNQKDKVAVCAFDPAQYPDRNVSCFSLEQCTKAVKDYCGDTTSEESGSTVSCKSTSVADSFDSNYQPPECPPDFRYCYAPKNSTNVRLNIQIAGMTQVQDFEKYVSVIYQWMVGAGVTIAIVLVMVGGFQYVVGAASPGQVGKGKERIKNAVVGLILLLCCILIVEAVNPRLSTISVPRLPMIKTIEVAGSGKSCEVLADSDGFQVGVNKSGTMYSNGTNSPGCGGVGFLLKGPNSADVPAGLTCNFKDCPNDQVADGKDRERCVGSGTNAACLKCEQIFDGSDALEGKSIIPSASTCGQFGSGTTMRGGKPVTVERCLWTKDGDFGDGIGAGKFLTNGACAYMRMDCSNVKTCGDYGKVELYNDSEGTETLSSADTERDEFSGCLGDCSNFSYKTICEENPCQIPGGCKMPTVYHSSLSPDVNIGCIPGIVGAIIEHEVEARGL